MENASKALILAGSVLIAVMLVSLGVYIYQRVSAVDPNIDPMIISSWNAQWDSYLGSDMKNNEAIQLVEKALLIDADKKAARTMSIKAVGGGSFKPSVSEASNMENLQKLQNDVRAANKDTVFDIALTNRDTQGAYSEITITGKKG